MKNKFLLRVMSGKYRGRGIVSPQNFDVRPTTGRIKGSLFNIIRNDLQGKTFLDLFGGTGQMGIEAVSNGVKKCYIADKLPALARQNAENILENDEFEIISGDFISVLNSFTNRNIKVDYIFADPPYREGFYDDIISNAEKVLAPDGVLILEHSSDMKIENTGDFEVKDIRAYGSRSLTFLGGKQ